MLALELISNEEAIKVLHKTLMDEESSNKPVSDAEDRMLSKDKPEGELETNLNLVKQQQHRKRNEKEKITSMKQQLEMNKMRNQTKKVRNPCR